MMMVLQDIKALIRLVKHRWYNINNECARAVIGSQAGLRCQCPQGRGGSSPLARTNKFLGGLRMYKYRGKTIIDKPEDCSQ